MTSKLLTITREALALAYRTIVALLAYSSVVARIRAAVPAELAPFAAEIWSDTLTDVITTFRKNFATPAVKTGRGSTRIRIDFASQTGKPTVTLALVAVAARVLASAAVLTRLRAANTRRY
ncbi:hypothetical protein PUN28_004853 [Cardiocondyla obscurior]|uniref:Uncharacterized protein n=1 Tax=Cardiocondyla obscurior TaxID=286306 RepID=A0AAW2GCH9_9HYME